MTKNIIQTSKYTQLKLPWNGKNPPKTFVISVSMKLNMETHATVAKPWMQFLTRQDGNTGLGQHYECGNLLGKCILCDILVGASRRLWQFNNKQLCCIQGANGNQWSLQTNNLGAILLTLTLGYIDIPTLWMSVRSKHTHSLHFKAIFNICYILKLYGHLD